MKELTTKNFKEEVDKILYKLYKTGAPDLLSFERRDGIVR